jgi:hypothetical protein
MVKSLVLFFSFVFVIVYGTYGLLCVVWNLLNSLFILMRNYPSFGFVVTFATIARFLFDGLCTLLHMFPTLGHNFENYHKDHKNALFYVKLLYYMPRIIIHYMIDDYLDVMVFVKTVDLLGIATLDEEKMKYIRDQWYPSLLFFEKIEKNEEIEIECTHVFNSCYAAYYATGNQKYFDIMFRVIDNSLRSKEDTKNNYDTIDIGYYSMKRHQQKHGTCLSYKNQQILDECSHYISNKK